MSCSHGRSVLLLATVLVLSPCSSSRADRGGSDVDTCLECHRPARHGLPMHPMGVRPARSRGLPLEDGRITCLTCHRRHGVTIESTREADFHLRRQPPRLCGSCHVDGQGRWDRPHALYADTIHGGPRLAGWGADDDRGIDPVSMRCLSCHDGSSAPSVDNGRSGGIGTEGGANHPVGMSGGLLAVRADADGAARWVAGRVSCASCHRLYGRPRPHLAEPTSMDRLCQGCHHY